MNLEGLFKRCTEIEYIHIQGGGSYAYEKADNTLYLYFEKSNGYEDWKSNLDFPIKRYKEYSYAHRGFLRVWESLEMYISKIIKHTSFQKIVIAGYSHGGALAVLCHEYIWVNFPHFRDSLEGYGFGAPRVVWGFLGKKKQLWERFYVIRNIDDLVTHLPPSLFGFRHVGTLVKIGKRGNYSMIEAHKAENILRELEKISYFF